MELTIDILPIVMPTMVSVILPIICLQIIKTKSNHLSVFRTNCVRMPLHLFLFEQMPLNLFLDFLQNDILLVNSLDLKSCKVTH